MAFAGRASHDLPQKLYRRIFRSHEHRYEEGTLDNPEPAELLPKQGLESKGQVETDHDSEDDAPEETPTSRKGPSG